MLPPRDDDEPKPETFKAPRTRCIDCGVPLRVWRNDEPPELAHWNGLSETAPPGPRCSSCHRTLVKIEEQREEAVSA